MRQKILSYIIKNKLFFKDQRLLLAISGGVDSVVLLDVLAVLGYKITLAHCNFNLRGSESDGDEQFVRGLAKKYEVPIFVKSFDTENAKVAGSTQMVARELRYTWFNQLIDEQKLDNIITAHHLNDSIETLLLNLTKGSGVSGLRGIKAKTNNIVRPLLEISKSEIIEYAQKNKLSFREDSSNASDKYQRNKIRNQVVPLLKEINPAFENSALQTINNLKEGEQIIEKTISKKWKKLVKQEGGVIKLPIKKLKKLNPINTYIYQFFKLFNFDNNQTQQIIDLLDSQSGKKIESNIVFVYKDRENLIIEPKIQQKSEVYIITNDTKAVLNLSFEITDKTEVSKNSEVATLDFDKLKFPLILRKWEIGDKFAPIGMGGKEKKLSDFFIDNKLSVSAKKKAWILESNNQICWVVGMRVSEKFKIGKNTKNTYLVKILK